MKYTIYFIDIHFRDLREILSQNETILTESQSKDNQIKEMQYRLEREGCK